MTRLAQSDLNPDNWLTTEETGDLISSDPDEYDMTAEDWERVRRMMAGLPQMDCPSLDHDAEEAAQ